jgi:hypothetical protein
MFLFCRLQYDVIAGNCPWNLFCETKTAWGSMGKSLDKQTWSPTFGYQTHQNDKSQKCADKNTARVSATLATRASHGESAKSNHDHHRFIQWWNMMNFSWIFSICRGFPKIGVPLFGGFLIIIHPLIMEVSHEKNTTKSLNTLDCPLTHRSQDTEPGHLCTRARAA